MYICWSNIKKIIRCIEAQAYRVDSNVNYKDPRFTTSIFNDRPSCITNKVQ